MKRIPDKLVLDSSQIVFIPVMAIDDLADAFDDPGEHSKKVVGKRLIIKGANELKKWFKRRPPLGKAVGCLDIQPPLKYFHSRPVAVPWTCSATALLMFRPVTRSSKANDRLTPPRSTSDTTADLFPV